MVNNKEAFTKPIYDYFYGEETLKFAFYRVPVSLVLAPEFKDVSNDAKLLYGLLLDRSTLSQKNGWMDEYNRVYIIYTIESVMQDMNVGRGKAVKLLKELTDHGLVTKKKQGQGKPTKLYVHNFFKSIENPMKSENRILRSPKIELQEVPNTDFLDFHYRTPGSSDLEHQEVLDAYPNHTEEKQIQDTIFRDYPSDSIDRQIDRYISLIQDNLDYSENKYSDKNRQKAFDELYSLLCDVICVPQATVKINGKDYPYAVVKNVFLKLRTEHLEYVMERMMHTTQKIHNVRNYLVSSLYNSYFTIEHFYTNEVNTDQP